MENLNSASMETNLGITKAIKDITENRNDMGFYF